DDQVAPGQAGGLQEPLKPLAGLAGQRPPGEGVVIRPLVGEDEQAEPLEAPPVDRPHAERRVRGDPEGVEAGPAEAPLATGQGPGGVGGGAGVDPARGRAWRLIWQVTGVVGVALIAAIRRRGVAEVRASCVVLSRLREQADRLLVIGAVARRPAAAQTRAGAEREVPERDRQRGVRERRGGGPAGAGEVRKRAAG